MALTKIRVGKALILASFPIIAVVLAGHFFGPTTEPGYKVDVAASVASIHNLASSDGSAAAGASGNIADVPASPAPARILTPGEAAELQDWYNARGQFEEDQSSDYAGYSEDVLKDLGKKGDLKALDLLINRAISRGDSTTAMSLMNHAVIFGSTQELRNLTVYTRPQSSNDATEEARRPAVLETLAVSRVISLRGDKILAATAANSFVSSYKELYGVDLAITPDEQARVERRAQEIYDGFQKARHKKGLGDFDNSEPTVLNKIFGQK